MKRESFDPCHWCGELILPGDEVSPMILNGGADRVHLECGYRMIAGGVNHILGRCTCCGGTEPPDPPHMTKREAARAALGAGYATRHK